MMMSVQRRRDLLRRLEEKEKMRKKWVEAAAKIARAWRKEGKLKPLYIVDAFGKGESWYAVEFIFMPFFLSVG
jgi:muconolactone delta-isomerase